MPHHGVKTAVSCIFFFLSGTTGAMKKIPFTPVCVIVVKMTTDINGAGIDECINYHNECPGTINDLRVRITIINHMAVIFTCAKNTI